MNAIINDPLKAKVRQQNKQSSNRSWYIEKGYLILRIKSLLIKYNINTQNCSLNLNYVDKTPQELEQILKDLYMYIAYHNGFLQPPPKSKISI